MSLEASVTFSAPSLPLFLSPSLPPALLIIRSRASQLNYRLPSPTALIRLPLRALSPSARVQGNPSLAPSISCCCSTVTPELMRRSAEEGDGKRAEGNTRLIIPESAVVVVLLTFSLFSLLSPPLFPPFFIHSFHSAISSPDSLLFNDLFVAQQISPRGDAVSVSVHGKRGASE